MEISYKREMKHNYLVIEGDNQSDSYEVRMMAGNVIEGLMKFRLKRVDDRSCYCYEITSKQPLSRLLESKSLKAEEIRLLILEMSKTLNKMEQYLLKEDQILLQPDYIYVEPELFSVEFCLVPGRDGNFPGELCKLLEYLLGKVDYQDKECVVMTYGMYRESLKENYGMENLLKYLINIDSQGKEKDDESKTDKNVLEKVHPDSLKIENEAAGSTVGLMSEYPEQPKFSQKESWKDRLQSKIKQLFGRSSVKKVPKPHVDEETQLPWQMIFEHENINKEEMKESPYPGNNNNRTVIKEEYGSNTVLLYDKNEKHIRKLISLDDKVQDICIAYYPFIIGKQEDLVDFMLDYDTVSRLHLRIDDENGTYRITDLNSTNGTEVAGVMLENNESSEVKLGDVVTVAGLRFQFA